MKIRKNNGRLLNPQDDGLPEDIIEIDRRQLYQSSEKICKDPDCRYPQVTLRILIYAIAHMEAEGIVGISTRELSKTFAVHRDTITKCLKYLREADLLCLENAS